MKNIIYKRNFEKGQSLTEFAFGFLVLVLLVSGIVDLGRAFFTYMALNDAVQEGALYGSLNPTNEAGIRSRIQGIAIGPIDMSEVIVQPPEYLGPICTGNQIVITATYNFRLTQPLISAIVGQEFPISATVTDFIINPPCQSN
jgi:hypothetical protein